MAYSELAGSGHFCGLSRSLDRPGQSAGSDSGCSSGGSVEATLTTIRWSSRWSATKARDRVACARWPRAAIRGGGRLVAGEFFDRRADIAERAGADLLIDFIELGFALSQQVGVDGPAFRVHPPGFVEQAHVANFVTADDEIVPIGQIAAGELRQSADQPHRRHPALFQCGQSDQSRGGDASFGADEPNADARTSHEGERSWMKLLGGRDVDGPPRRAEPASGVRGAGAPPLGSRGMTNYHCRTLDRAAVKRALYTPVRSAATATVRPTAHVRRRSADFARGVLLAMTCRISRIVRPSRPRPRWPWRPRPSN